MGLGPGEWMPRPNMGGGGPMTGEDVVQGPLRAGSPPGETPRAAGGRRDRFFSVLLIAALVLLRLSVPADPRVAGSWLTDPRATDPRRASRWALVPFAGIAFLWFYRGTQGPDRPPRGPLFFGTVFLGSGVFVRSHAFRDRGSGGRAVRGRVRRSSGPPGPDNSGAGPRLSPGSC